MKTKQVLAGLTAAALAVGVFIAGFGAGAGIQDVQAGETGSNPGSSLNYTYTSTAASEKTPLTSYSGVYKAVSDAVVSINVVSTIQSTYISGGFDSGYPFGGWSSRQPGMSGGSFPAPRQTQGAGSGVIFNEDKDNIYIVTSFHVINGADECTISIDDEHSVPASYVGGDAYSDIAVLSVKKTGLKAEGIDNYNIAVFGDSDALEVGDQVMAVGNALGKGKSATLGIISAKNKNVTVDNAILTLTQTDAAINSGNSGGALVNMYGEVIGINTLKASGNNVEGIGYALPSNSFLEVIEEIMETGFVAHPYLGIEGRTVDEDTQKENDLPATGVYVNSVLYGCTAESMGMRAYDIITTYNGTTVKDMDHLRSLIQNTEIGEEITVEVVRSSYRNTGFYTTVTGSETVTLTGVMKNYTNDPEF